MTEEKTSRPNKKLLIIIVAIIAIALVAVLALFVPKSAEAKKLEAYLDLGDKYLSELDYEQAIVNYLAVIEIDPKNVDAYLGLADAYIALGEYDKAEDILKDALNELSGSEKNEIEDKQNKVREVIEAGAGTSMQPGTDQTTDSSFGGQEGDTVTDAPVSGLSPDGTSQSIVPMNLVGQTDVEGILIYHFTENGIYILNVNDYSVTEITIPEKIAGYPVIGIASFGPGEDSFFANCTVLNKISIPDSLWYVSEDSFRGCDADNITIGCSVNHPLIDWLKGFGFTKFDFDADMETESEIPESTPVPEVSTPVPTMAPASTASADGFRWEANGEGGVTVWYTDYTATGAITIPREIEGKKVTMIGDMAFMGCTGITEIEIPNTVTRIGEMAFADCFWLKSIRIPNSVTIFGDMMFMNCTGLRSVELPDSMMNIGAMTFSGCSSLSEVKLPYNLQMIGDMAFENCLNLSYVEFSDSIYSIGEGAFYNCPALSDIRLPYGLLEIGGSAFQGCTGLTYLQIPDCVMSIGDSAFSDCTGLTFLEIPGSVTRIGALAFAACTGLTDVTIMDGVTEIGESAFISCSNLGFIFIPGSVTNIENSVFLFCDGLRICTTPGSFAESWGNENGFEVVY